MPNTSHVPPVDFIQHLVPLLVGAVGGALFLLFAYYARPLHTRKILARGLIIAALVYIYFSVDAHTSTSWLLVELLGVGIYGTLGMLGLRRSAWWLVAGWAAHPVWDIAIHYVGPGSEFAPAWYTIPCLSWDLVVAGALAYRLARGWTPALQPS